jgi:hypothetical protein
VDAVPLNVTTLSEGVAGADAARARESRSRCDDAAVDVKMPPEEGTSADVARATERAATDVTTHPEGAAGAIEHARRR